MEGFTLLEYDVLQRAELLELFSLSVDLSDSQLTRLADYVRVYIVPSGIPILKEGDSNRALYLICAGEVTVTKSDYAAHEKTINSIHKGQVIGELSFFDNGPCSATVVAKGDVTLLAMSKSEFDRLCNDATYLAVKFLLNLFSYVSQRLRQATGNLVDFL